MSDSTLLNRILREAASGVGSFQKRRLTLVLSSDREIGRETFSQERRVGIVPSQVAELKEGFHNLGLALDILVVQGAGERAGYPDEDYIRAGAEIVTVDELQYHDAPPDVVHALKEPSSFERVIPRPFFRIGALHTGAFHEETGLAGLLAPARDVANRSASDFVTVFDGSNIGASESFRIPIRGSMSEFAGDIAGTWVDDHLDRHDLKGRVVIVGGGNAGRAAVRRSLKSQRVADVHLFDSSAREDRLVELALAWGHDPRVSVFGIDGVDHPRLVDSLRGSVACVLAVAKAGQQAPRVVRAKTLQAFTHPGSITVDISIDERGAIEEPRITSSMPSEQIIPALEQGFRRSRRWYRAIPNMPRANPGQASETHGRVVLPYLATLLVLSAEHGGVTAASEYLASLTVDPAAPDPARLPDEEVRRAMAQDLRNGMAFYPRSGRLVVEGFIGDHAGIHGFLSRRNVPFEFTVPATDLARARLRYSTLPTSIHASLDYLAAKGVPFTLIYHPDVDGTQTENAARALGVLPRDVLKCLIVKAIETEDFVVAVCSGSHQVSEEKLARLTGHRGVRLASVEDAQRVAGGHEVGGVPIFELLADRRPLSVAGVYVDHDVTVDHSVVCASAGSAHWGIKFDPRYLADMEVVVTDITEPSPLTAEQRARLLKDALRLLKALEREDLGEAQARLRKIRTGLMTIGVPTETLVP